MPGPTDFDEQPHWGFNVQLREDRDISEMLGLVKGLLADGVIVEGEVFALRDWIDTHPDAIRLWPCSQIAKRMDAILEDGVVTDEERLDLKDLLANLVGGRCDPRSQWRTRHRERGPLGARSLLNRR